MIAKYLGKIGYKSGTVMQGFLVCTQSDIDQIIQEKRKIVILGVGENGFYAEKLLQEYGGTIYAFADNSERIQNQKIRKRKIYSPYELFGNNEYYFIIAVQNNNIGCVRLQFMTHNIEDYGIFLNTSFHDFVDEDEKLHSSILDAINEICFENEDIKSAMPQVGMALGRDGSQLGSLNWLLKSTQWSHYAYLWSKEALEYNSKAHVLEIGPGFGLMSSTLLHMFNDSYVDWVLFGDPRTELNVQNGEYEKGLQKIYGKYKDRVKVQYQYIEMDQCTVEHFKYDLIIMTEVFEHFVLNPINTLLKIASALKNHGKLIITTPNWGHLHIYKSWSEPPNSSTININRYLELNECGHTYQYSRTELESIFEKSKLIVRKYELSDSNNHNFLLEKNLK